MKKVKMMLTIAVVLAAVGSGLAFRARPKFPTNLFIYTQGICIRGCSTQGTAPCPYPAYSDAACLISADGFEADQ